MILEKLNSIENSNLHFINRYFKFVNWCKEQKFEGYTEKHHILPKCLFNDHKDDEWNLVEMSPRHHFIAHVLLAKAYGGRLWFAVHMMTNCDEGGERNYRVSSRIYEASKKNRAIQLSLDMSGKNNPMFGTSRSGKDNPNYGNKHSDEAKNKISEANKNYYSKEENKMFGEKNGMFGKTLSDEAKNKLAESNRGRIPSEYARRRTSETHKGKYVSQETRDKLSSSLKGVNKGVKKPESHGKNLSAAKIGSKKVYRIDGTSFISHRDNLHLYFIRDGKYYDFPI